MGVTRKAVLGSGAVRADPNVPSGLAAERGLSSPQQRELEAKVENVVEGPEFASCGGLESRMESPRSDRGVLPR